MPLIKGFSAFPLTPSDEDGRVDVPALRRVLARLLRAEVDSIGLLGSTGTYPYLTRGERRRALEAAVEEAGGRVPILVGVGALRTDDAVRLAQDAKAVGAAAGLLAPVSYTPLNDEEVFEHFSAVARESGLPLCIYDNPGTTHFKFSLALLSRLSRLENVVALKTPAPERAAAAEHTAALRRSVPERFSLGYSVDERAAEGLLAGGDVWYSVAGGIVPQRCIAVARAAQRGDAAEARRLHAALQPLWDLFREFSGLRVVYAIADQLGICSARPPRPILPLPEPAQRKVGAMLQRLELN